VQPSGFRQNFDTYLLPEDDGITKWVKDKKDIIR
jgi:hypothetical protein